MTTKRHACDVDRCFKVIRGKLVNVCRYCPETAMEAVLGYTPRATYRLRSGEAMHRKYPTTFEIPDKEIRTGLKKGDFAKMVFTKGKGGKTAAERMWVKISSKTGTGRQTKYTGKLKNKPVMLDIKYGETIAFGPQHVINVTGALGSEYSEMTLKQKECASDFIAEEMHELETGRKGRKSVVSSRKQAIAIGLSRARSEC